MSDFEKDAIWSENMLKDVVWPAIKQSVGGDILSVEGDGSNIARQMDMSAGIDALIQTERGIKSVASRVQRCNPSKPWNTFTIRVARNTHARTELEKRLSAIKSRDSVYPMFTMQAYVSERDESFASAAIIRTEQLYAYYDSEFKNIPEQRASNAIFKVIRWDLLSKWMQSKNIHSDMDIFHVQMTLDEWSK